MFKIFTKNQNKPFIISPEFAKEILESRTTTEKQDEIKKMASEFEKNNLKGKIKVKKI